MPAIGGLLPAAVAVALSPIPIVAIVMVLGTPRAKSNGMAFSVGWVTGLVSVSVVVLLIAGGASDPESGTSDAANGIKVVLGVVFLVMAAKEWRKRPRRGEEAEMPSWMAAIDAVTPPKALGLGLALSAANPKNLALTLAASASIAQAGLDRTDTVLAVVAFVGVGSITVVGSTLFSLVAHDRAEGPLATVRQFMSDNNAVIMMIVLLVLGAKLIGDGVGGLGSL